MNSSELAALQRSFFESGKTRPLEFRLAALRRLQAALRANEALLSDALAADLGKDPMESYMCETGLVLEEIRYHIKHLPRWIRDRRTFTPLAQFLAKSFISPEPYGLVLILAPWNYPVQLCLSPLVGAISAGNCAVIKPSAYAPHTSHALAGIIGSAFPPEYIAVVEGGRAENQALLDLKFDYIFFTGSVAVGRVVMEAAARHLTPVTLELGGKSPAIVDKTANLKLAARRIAFGKVLNAGQTCVAPDYLFLQSCVKDAFTDEYRQALCRFFPGGNLSDMPSIINEKHYRRILGLMEGQTVLLGGGCDDGRRLIEPTLLGETDPASPIMQEEIFGPVLPVMTFDTLDQVVSFIRQRPKPLALYLFTESREHEKFILDRCSFGGGCINDTIIHLATSYMPFGGVGASGMGSYHGRESFETFTHRRSIVKKSTRLDLPMRYMPYSDRKMGVVRRFMK